MRPRRLAASSFPSAAGTSTRSIDRPDRRARRAPPSRTPRPAWSTSSRPDTFTRSCPVPPSMAVCSRMRISPTVRTSTRPVNRTVWISIRPSSRSIAFSPIRPPVPPDSRPDRSGLPGDQRLSDTAGSHSGRKVSLGPPIARRRHDHATSASWLSRPPFLPLPHREPQVQRLTPSVSVHSRRVATQTRRAPGRSAQAGRTGWTQGRKQSRPHSDPELRRSRTATRATHERLRGIGRAETM